jgi:predicted RND superfamily exporter protein
MQVVADVRDFNHRSGNLMERLIFNHRPAILAACLLISVVLAFCASRLVVNASFERMIPQSHPYIQNYLEHKADLRGLGNSLRIVVERLDGDIYDAEFLRRLAAVSDAVYLLPGVDRAGMKSLMMPSVRWVEVTEEGFRDGPVVPPDFDGSVRAIDAVRSNVRRGNLLGSLVATDQKSTMIFVPLLDTVADTGRPLDYERLSRSLEDLKDRFEAGTAAPPSKDARTPKVRIHIVGFAKLMGDLIAGLRGMLLFFAAATVVTSGIIFFYTRCVRSTLLVVASSLLAVVWQLGLIRLFGFELDPYSILVPFLVFAIGVSHGTQKMNGIMQDVGRGTHKYVAARYTFRRLFVAGVTALLTNIVGFAVLMVIEIPVIRQLALAASIGVGTLVITKLILVPIMLSYIGVSPSAARRSVAVELTRDDEAEDGRLWRFICRFTERRHAVAAIAVAAVIAAIATALASKVQIGDTDAGAPELRADSVYNRDVGFVNDHYGQSSDQFAMIVKTRAAGCDKYTTLVEADRLGWALRQLPQVQGISSLAESVRAGVAGGMEGDPKWQTISRNQGLVNPAVQRIASVTPEILNTDCSVFPVIAYLSDHKAQTLDQVVRTMEEFSASHDAADRKFLLAAGSAGIEAVTNVVVEKANRTIVLLVYASVILCCYVTFRSWRAVLVALIPLLITSALCEAIMVALGIGMKVATLPVIALGVGVGVDYALYLLSVQLALQRRGASLHQAYRGAVRFTGKVVALIGITMAAGVVTWAFSPIKFQADMGILLTFMFLWNMVGALLLIPALSHFLLNARAERAPPPSLA